MALARALELCAVVPAILILASMENALTVAVKNCTIDRDDLLIMFSEQPDNTKVCVNRTAFFSCNYNGTSVHPSWKINSVVYSSSNLPFNTNFNATSDTLIVNEVKPYQASYEYQCFFTVEDPGKKTLCDIVSTVGTLQLYSDVAPDACVCRDDVKSVCSCFQDNVTLSINEVNITNSSSSEDFATLVHCFSKFSENVAIGLVIVIESELIAENKKQNIATCSSVTTMTMIPHSKIICEEVNNVTVSYKVSVYVASFQHESLSENCLLTTQKFVRELSRCQPDEKTIINLVAAPAITAVTLSLVAIITMAFTIIFFCSSKRHHYHHYNPQNLKIRRESL